ncbi:MAG: hypothetical protein MUF49_06350 [Oculatellaceae cyanobacterium Prado106]|nr:hypothetical protein [Oculatellaceae cyanobacterium Prado106]
MKSLFKSSFVAYLLLTSTVGLPFLLAQRAVASSLHNAVNGTQAKGAWVGDRTSLLLASAVTKPTQPYGDDPDMEGREGVPRRSVGSGSR